MIASWLRSHWLDIFHNLVIPFLGGFAVTLAKLVADGKLLSFDESNDIGLDLVLVAVGALGALYIQIGHVEATIDAGIGDAFLAAILIYLRFERTQRTPAAPAAPPPIGWVAGILQLALGTAALIWTVGAF